jgi:SAM-dependent methyltransferase
MAAPARIRMLEAEPAAVPSRMVASFDFEDLIRGAERVLEIGCGGGSHVPQLVDRCGLGAYTGIDSNADAIAAARSVESRYIRFLCADLLAGATLDGTYDAIFCHDLFILLDFERKERMIRILMQHLRPGGVMVINDFNHFVFPGNALASLLRPRLHRAAYFLFCWARYGLQRILRRDPEPINDYWFGDEMWYRSAGRRLGAEVTWRNGEGLFLRGRKVKYFQAVSDRVFRQRDLIILRRANGS